MNKYYTKLLKDISNLFLLGFSIFCLLSLLPPSKFQEPEKNFAGPVGSFFAEFVIFKLFGWSAYLIPLFLIVMLIKRIKSTDYKTLLGVVGVFLSLTSLSVLLNLCGGCGGLLGDSLGDFLFSNLKFSTFVLIILMALFSLSLTFGFNFKGLKRLNFFLSTKR